MKTVILCGGLGTRLSEETQVRPKPMVEVGGRPILWHIMKMYEQSGFRHFILALGYKGEVIKDYFVNYHARNSDITTQLSKGINEYSNSTTEDWTIEMVDTGLDSMTGGRLGRLKSRLTGEDSFMLTYGDGVADIDIAAVVRFHERHGKLATVTAVRPPARFGTMTFDGDRVAEFREKPQTGEGWINGGFMVMRPGVFDYLRGDDTVLEQDSLTNLARDGELMAYRHEGFWLPMDTVRDRDLLNKLWKEGSAKWKTWEQR